MTEWIFSLNLIRLPGEDAPLLLRQSRRSRSGKATSEEYLDEIA